MTKLLYFLLCSLTALPSGAQDTAQLEQLQQEGSWDRILALARSAPAPGIRLLNAAGYAAYQMGDRPEALVWYARSLALDSSGRPALYYTALICKTEDREPAAIPLLQRLCRLAPDNAGYQQLLGDCYTANDQHPAAVDAYRRAFRLSPGSVPIVVRLATALQQAALPEQADTLLRSALARHPGTPALINSAVALAYARKQYERCATLCDSLIATGKMSYRSLVSGLYADIARPDFRHAVRLGEVLIAMDAGTEDVLFYTAIAHQKLGELKQADTLLRQCAAKILKPQLADTYEALAAGAEAQGQYQRSKAYYDTAYYLFKRPETLYRAGRMLDAHGMGSAAKPVYRRYLSLPENRRDTAVSRYLKEKLK